MAPVYRYGRLVYPGSVVASPREESEFFCGTHGFRQKEVIEYLRPESLESVRIHARMGIEALASQLLPIRGDLLNQGGQIGYVGRPGRILSFVHRRVPPRDTAVP